MMQRHIKSEKDWLDFIQKAPSSNSYQGRTRTGSWVRAPQLSLGLEDDDGQLHKLYGTEPTLRMLGKAAPALIRHAGVPVMLVGEGELHHSKSLTDNIDALEQFMRPYEEFTYVQLLPPVARSIIDYNKHGVIGANIYFAFANLKRPVMIQCPSGNDPWSAQRWQSYLLGGLPTNKLLLSANDYMIWSMAHETSHARQTRNFIGRLKSTNPASRMRLELEADAAALQFIKQNPDLCDADFETISNTVMVQRRMDAIYHGDVEHMTALALPHIDSYNLSADNELEIGLYLSEQAVLFRNRLDEELCKKGIVKLEPGEYYAKRIYQTRSVEERLIASIEIAQDFVINGEFKSNPLIHRMLEDFTSDMDELVPHLTRKRPTPGRQLGMRLV